MLGGALGSLGSIQFSARPSPIDVSDSLRRKGLEGRAMGTQRLSYLVLYLEDNVRCALCKATQEGSSASKGWVSLHAGHIVNN